MDELLQKLLENEILTEETRDQLRDALKVQLDEAVADAKKETEESVRVELTEKWINEREQLVEALETKMDSFMTEEVEELRRDIEGYRDLEAEYAQKLVEAKQAMADELKGDMKTLVEKLDNYLEIRISAEVEELREDIEEQKLNTFGRRIAEAFAEDFMTNFYSEEETGLTINEMQERLDETQEALQRAEKRANEAERSIKLENLLGRLEGNARKLMEAILSKVDTQHLEEGYNTFIGRVLNESEIASEKENRVLAEGYDCDDDDDDDKEEEEEEVTKKVKDPKGKKTPALKKDANKVKDKNEVHRKNKNDTTPIKESVYLTGDREQQQLDESAENISGLSSIDSFRRLAGLL
jgi:hypothetical protein